MYCCWIGFELIFCYIYIVETKNLTLEETAALFDGKEALEQIEQSAAIAQAPTDIREDDEKASQAQSSQHEINKI